MIKDTLLQFTTVGTPYAPTGTGDNIAPLTYDTAPLGLPSGSGGAGTTGYNAGSAANAGRDLGPGHEMWFVATVTTAVTSSGTTGVSFVLATDTAAALSNVVAATGVGVLIASPSFVKATLVAKFQYQAQLPSSLVYNEYVGMDVAIITTALSAGAFEGELVMNIYSPDLYLSGFAIS